MRGLGLVALLRCRRLPSALTVAVLGLITPYAVPFV